ncbi:MAG: hypothetical protein B7Y56_02510 [Gallionellales bacterium 35-53-114]|jgi:hypothetical protein|nr:MAG: hypothetical protein B7Y56_02510 [Gallionellales bacterium 35-53-114]OYZ64488.1 MAG: hypothetical protein B7Y04_06290 [Gallionellales bacterium 24-53-125]OZB10206.1 MAG: hypothetical protein B7X61_01420 [Gallionellales bacterium 39-52-133]HQS56795.1 hypothetical protein [Gallionellaceae bacterium]HQS75421.1 hypothetical protein [Gallionellaceae bacterium]
MRSKIRVKSSWHKGDRKKTPQEIAGALAFIIWRISDNTLKNVRKADFDIAIGPQYFAFLQEFLIFLVMVADRIVYTQLGEDDRIEFTGALANRVAEHMAENQVEWLGGPLREYKDSFIDRLNQRAGEYADFHYTGVETSFSFILHLGQCMRDVVDEKDKTWVVDQIMAIEVPESVAMLEKAMTGLFDEVAKPVSAAE